MGPALPGLAVRDRKVLGPSVRPWVVCACPRLQEHPGGSVVAGGAGVHTPPQHERRAAWLEGLGPQAVWIPGGCSEDRFTGPIVWLGGLWGS
jgi:hypothetical protein